MNGSIADRRKSILITGAASGIGRATAILFAGKGWFVGCLDMNAAALESLRDELSAHPGLFRRVDVIDRPALLAVVDEFAASTGGTLDLLFNKAGIDATGRFETMPWEKVVKLVHVNLLGGMSLIHATVPLLKATTGSLCLSTASASAIFGTADLAVYSATKHAVKGLTEALSVEFAAMGVRAADILPGTSTRACCRMRRRPACPPKACCACCPPGRSRRPFGTPITATSCTGTCRPNSRTMTWK